MLQKNIIVPKTARYFISGDPTLPVHTLWFVCHGYGQLASYFLNHFKTLEQSGTLIIAPEGLHRFYWEKFSGRVVASWMTKEDRTEDIKDYIHYLDVVYDEVMSGLKKKEVKVNVIGFSQGTATVCRWLENKKSTADSLILWAGGIPEDIGDSAMFNSLNLHIVTGDKDEFISEDMIRKQEVWMTEKKITFRHIRFRGKHEINAETLQALSLML